MVSRRVAHVGSWVDDTIQAPFGDSTAARAPPPAMPSSRTTALPIAQSRFVRDGLTDLTAALLLAPPSVRNDSTPTSTTPLLAAGVNKALERRVPNEAQQRGQDTTSPEVIGTSSPAAAPLPPPPFPRSLGDEDAIRDVQDHLSAVSAYHAGLHERNDQRVVHQLFLESQQSQPQRRPTNFYHPTGSSCSSSSRHALPPPTSSSPSSSSDPSSLIGTEHVMLMLASNNAISQLSLQQFLLYHQQQIQESMDRRRHQQQDPQIHDNDAPEAEMGHLPEDSRQRRAAPVAPSRVHPSALRTTHGDDAEEEEEEEGRRSSQSLKMKKVAFLHSDPNLLVGNRLQQQQLLPSSSTSKEQRQGTTAAAASTSGRVAILQGQENNGGNLKTSTPTAIPSQHRYPGHPRQEVMSGGSEVVGLLQHDRLRRQQRLQRPPPQQAAPEPGDAVALLSSSSPLRRHGSNSPPHSRTAAVRSHRSPSSSPTGQQQRPISGNVESRQSRNKNHVGPSETRRTMMYEQSSTRAQGVEQQPPLFDVHAAVHATCQRLDREAAHHRRRAVDRVPCTVPAPFTLSGFHELFSSFPGGGGSADEPQDDDDDDPTGWTSAALPASGLVAQQAARDPKASRLQRALRMEAATSSWGLAQQPAPREDKEGGGPLTASRGIAPPSSTVFVQWHEHCVETRCFSNWQQRRGTSQHGEEKDEEDLSWVLN